MNAYHHLTPDQLGAAASGAGDPSVIVELNASRVSIHMLLLVHVIQNWNGEIDQRDTAVFTLAAAQAADRQSFARLIGDPIVGSWLSSTTRSASRLEDCLYLGNLAAAAAVGAGLDCQVTGWAQNGRLVLPALGTATLGDDYSGPVGIRSSNAVISVTGPSGSATQLTEGVDWWPLRHLQARHDHWEISVRLEDASPYRDSYHAPPAPRLDDKDVAYWQSQFTRAWSLLCRHLPEQAEEIALGLRAIVPFADLGDGSSRSATARESVGALGMNRPDSAEDFAITIVHEFAHSKLSAIVDVEPLYRPGAERHHAPWKTDKRPTSALLQGVFAFLQVAEAWRCIASEPELAEVAHAQLIDLRDQVSEGYRSLASSRELTEAGAEFVAIMETAVQRLFEPPVPPAPGVGKS